MAVTVVIVATEVMAPTTVQVGMICQCGSGKAITLFGSSTVLSLLTVAATLLAGSLLSS